jgi:uroporphyrinogen decarboxylase
MTTSRERVLQALNFQSPDRVPKDLGGMRSTGISAFAYPGLLEALGLPPRLPRVEDTGQMLALPDLDVLDALGCDVVTIADGATNAFEEPEMWHPYDFGGRLPARVRNPSAFKTRSDGTILQDIRQMPPSSYVFDEPHGGQPLHLFGELPKPDLAQLKQDLDAHELRDKQIREQRELCRRVRESSDRAVFISDGSLQAPICIHGYGGLAVFPVLCLLEPDWVGELHEMVTTHTLKNIRALLPEIAPYIDVIMMAADDWGTQESLIASPKVFRELFLPYRRRMNDEIHRIAPQVKTFLHSCGAIYPLIDLIIESAFDVLNPVQWPAGTHSYREWKEKARARITLWGGGVNSQATLSLGTVEDVKHEVSEVVRYLSQDGGYVFCNIHNILAEIPPQKIIALYRGAECAHTIDARAGR